ncbi:MAG: CRISPR-associated endonuclease Cas2 [Candidatus Cloacimonetes bacterium]|nr:CRISPR-associated endonuclease Cas2 [Candidatus Cloacimonadota bacterium]
MWLVLMFDLPVDTKRARKDYTVFRKNLLKDGFTMMQFSVMTRHCPTEENAEVHRKRVRGFLPPDGEVRILTFTDKQFGRMQVFNGRVRAATESTPQQLTIFDKDTIKTFGQTSKTSKTSRKPREKPKKQPPRAQPEREEKVVPQTCNFWVDSE